MSGQRHCQPCGEACPRRHMLKVGGEKWCRSQRAVQPRDQQISGFYFPLVIDGNITGIQVYFLETFRQNQTDRCKGPDP